MKIRIDPSEHVVRSVGAPPNGILCIGAPDGKVTWLIDAQYQPPRVEGAPGVLIDGQSSEHGMGPASTPIEPDDLVAACEGADERRALMLLVSSAVVHAAEERAGDFEYEFVESHIQLAIETRDALARQGFLRRANQRPPGPGPEGRS